MTFYVIFFQIDSNKLSRFIMCEPNQEVTGSQGGEQQEKRFFSVDHTAALSDDFSSRFLVQQHNDSSAPPDVVLHINRVEVKAHRLILTARSAFFR